MSSPPQPVPDDIQWIDLSVFEVFGKWGGAQIVSHRFFFFLVLWLSTYFVEPKEKKPARREKMAHDFLISGNKIERNDKLRNIYKNKLFIIKLHWIANLQFVILFQNETDGKVRRKKKCPFYGWNITVDSLKRCYNTHENIFHFLYEFLTSVLYVCVFFFVRLGIFHFGNAVNFLLFSLKWNYNFFLAAAWNRRFLSLNMLIRA